MIIIEYAEDGEPISDFHVTDWVNKISESQNEDKKFKVSTYISILAVRAHVASGKISHENVLFKFKNSFLEVNQNGRFLTNTPDGFADIYDDFLDMLLGLHH